MRYMVGHINGFVSREIYSMFVKPLGGHGLAHLAKVHVYTKSVIHVSIRPRTRIRTRTRSRNPHPQHTHTQSHAHIITRTHTHARTNADEESSAGPNVVIHSPAT